MERTDFALGEELKIYRRWRAGKPISEEHEQHFAALWPRQLEMLEQDAEMHDEQDERVRDEIARYPEAYGWHKTVGGGLPFDWTDSELTHLRPRDWKRARTVRFVRTTRRSVPRQPRVRPRERRPRVARRTSSGSTTSSSDPGDSAGDGEPPADCEHCGPREVCWSAAARAWLCLDCAEPFLQIGVGTWAHEENVADGEIGGGVAS